MRTQHICWRIVIRLGLQGWMHIYLMDISLVVSFFVFNPSDAFTGPPQPYFRTLSPVNLHLYLYVFVSGTSSGWNGLPGTVSIYICLYEQGAGGEGVREGGRFHTMDVS
ncbi:hypothetical protein EDD15DRAFT_2273515 [Pisolithus albus]|nr:hypothetical protein EDD15DRAFT_2273515 [Pisolithus albus]